MSRTVANVNIYTNSFKTWVDQTNELLNALTTEIITANNDLANTGVQGEERHSRLHGNFGANELVAIDVLRGGTPHVGNSGLLTIASNTFIGGNSSMNAQFINCHANVFIDNANTQVNSNIITITGNTSIKGNTSVIAINILGNSTVTNTVINGTDIFVTTTNTSVNSISIFTGNTSIKSNSSIILINARGNETTSNVVLSGNLTQITANLDVTGTVHTIAGNVAFDTITLFVDSVGNKVGVGTSSPDANLQVIGTANVSGVTKLANTLNVTGATTLSNTLNVTGATTLSNTLNVTGATTLSNTFSVVGTGSFGNTIISGLIPSGNTNLLGNSTARWVLSANSGNFSNTLNVTGATTLSNTLSVTGPTTFSNTITTNEFTITSYANSNLGSDISNPITIFNFNKTSYSTAKITTQIKTLSGNTLASEMVLAYNDVSNAVNMTVYATVVSPLLTNPGDFSAITDSSDVILKFKQNAISSASKVIATLIKA